MGPCGRGHFREPDAGEKKESSIKFFTRRPSERGAGSFTRSTSKSVFTDTHSMFIGSCLVRDPIYESETHTFGLLSLRRDCFILSQLREACQAKECVINALRLTSTTSCDLPALLKVIFGLCCLLFHILNSPDLSNMTPHSKCLMNTISQRVSAVEPVGSFSSEEHFLQMSTSECFYDLISSSALTQYGQRSAHFSNIVLH